MRHRVVVTGIGIVAANGTGKENFWAAIRAGSPCLPAIQAFAASPYRCQFAGEVADSAFDHPAVLDKASKMIMVAGVEALADAGLANAEPHDRKRTGVVVGTIHSGMLTFEKLCRHMVSGKTAEAAISQLGECALFTPSWHLARRFDLKGPRSTVTMACASGTAAVGYAASLITHGQADVMLAGGVDTVNDFILSGFYALKALSMTKCRPFDRGRDGMVIGEGAAILILESLEHAVARKARIYSEVIGYGLAGDAAHITAPDSEGGGLARAIFSALQEANLNNAAVDYINLHGVGTLQTDLMECKAINQCFREAASQIAISSTKPFTGHAMGAAGAIEAAVCLLAIRDGFIPGTLNCEHLDPAFNLNIIAAPGCQANIKVAMSTSSGLGGQNAAVIFSRLSPGDEYRAVMRVAQQKQRIVITGIGVVSPSAIGVEEHFNNLSGKEKPPIQLALSDIAIAMLAADKSPDEAKRIRQMDNISRYALLAARLATLDAKLDLSKTYSKSIGVVLGTAFGSLESDVQYYGKRISEKAPSLASPMAFRNTSSNIAAAQVAINLGIKGVNATIASGAVAGANAITYAYTLLQERRAELILSGGIEGSLAALTAMPQAALCFNGCGPSEGAAILTIEPIEAVKARQGDSYCEIAGYGMAHSCSEVSEAIEAAMRNALEAAELGSEQVDYIHTRKGHRRPEEEAAIRRLFGDSIKTEYSTNPPSLAPVDDWGAFSIINCIWMIRQGARRVISNRIGPDGNCVAIVLQNI